MINQNLQSIPKLRIAIMIPINAKKSQSSPILANVYFHITEQHALKLNN